MASKKIQPSDKVATHHLRLYADEFKDLDTWFSICKLVGVDPLETQISIPFAKKIVSVINKDK